MLRNLYLYIGLTLLSVTFAAISMTAHAQYAYGDELKKAIAQAQNAESAPTPIFGDDIRRFRFPFSDSIVSHELAEEFMVSYNPQENPDILGAYPDMESNSLVVIGPPEAEKAIRLTLARMLVDSMGPASISLKSQRKRLILQRKLLLRQMAEYAIERIDASENEQAEKRFAALEEELETELGAIEAKIEVVNQFIQRKQEFSPGSKEIDPFGANLLQ